MASANEYVVRGVHRIKLEDELARLQGRLQKRRLRDRLVEELGLRHAVVDGVAEFWC